MLAVQAKRILFVGAGLARPALVALDGGRGKPRPYR
jgi:hypothetical protein